MKSGSPDPRDQDRQITFDFDAVFDPENYLYFYEDSLTEERTEREVGFLVDALELGEPKRILDLACGHGRHANRLAARGHSVVGVDRSRRFLEVAEEEARDMDVRVEYIKGDMRELDYREDFDAALLLFTAFGYFNDEENAKVLANVARALRPGGAFCFDTLNRDLFLKILRPFTITEKNGDLMIDRVCFDVKTGCLTNRRIYIRDGRRTDAPFTVRLYNYGEIAHLLEGLGLTIQTVYGGWDGRPLENESRRMIILSEKIDGV